MRSSVTSIEASADVGAVPNITGWVSATKLSASQGNPLGSGALGVVTKADQFAGWYGTSGWKITKYSLDASKASNIYGGSVSVQAPSLLALPCIKI